jgi:hypothetical protein
MHFDTKEDANALFDWLMENTNHKQNACDVERREQPPLPSEG